MKVRHSLQLPVPFSLAVHQSAVKRQLNSLIICLRYRNLKIKNVVRSGTPLMQLTMYGYDM